MVKALFYRDRRVKITKESGRVLVLSGILVVILGVAFFIYRLYEMGSICSSDMCSTFCPHTEIPLVFLLSLAIGVILTLIGMYLHRRAPQTRIYVADTVPLSEDERKIVDILKKEGGIAFQSDLVEKTSFSKSKVSRLLDRLEAEGIIERRRRGITNVVILKLG